jgi:hypothetical protein
LSELISSCNEIMKIERKERGVSIPDITHGGEE